MFLRALYNEQLAQASYLVGCQRTGEALIVDPTRDLDLYRDLAAREGLRIAPVAETHIHADFVSGARELAARTGARLHLSGAGPAVWQYSYAGAAGATLVRDGEVFMVGELRLEVLHTPGHTPESVSFLLTDTAAATEPMGIFTGDFVFVGDVGRPDLLERAAGMAGTKEGAACQLYRSLQRFCALPDYPQVWPGHGAGSACGKTLGAVPQSTVGYERRTNGALDAANEGRFVQDVLDGQPEPPPYFARMKCINKEGPASIGDMPTPEPLDLDSLDAALAVRTVVVDTRPATVYAAGHIQGAINIPLGRAFLTWAGWLLPDDRPIALLAANHAAAPATRQLRLIGFDAVIGYWTPAVLDAWTASGRTPATLAHTDADALHRLLATGTTQVLDVRTAAEHAAGHIAGSINVPLGQLPRRMAEVRRDRAVVVHCAGGLHAAIAASLLDACGYSGVSDLTGGFSAWKEAGELVEQGVHGHPEGRLAAQPEQPLENRQALLLRGPSKVAPTGPAQGWAGPALRRRK